jgi:N4-gp56 family major capsid protein
MAFTDSAALSNQIATSYDRAAFLALRAEEVFGQFAQVKPGNVTNPGTPVVFTFWNDLAAATTPLAETIDVTPVALSDAQVTITPVELGNAILVTIKAQTDTFIIGFDADAANIVGWNAADSLETRARMALDAGGTASFVTGTTTSGIATANEATMNLFRREVAALRGANVRGYGGGYYAAVVHPDVAYDLMTETDLGSWGGFHTRQEPAEFYTGEVGRAAGLIFLESPRALIQANGGSGNTDVYTSYIFGDEAFGKAESIPLRVAPGPVTDILMRFMPLGWYTYQEYGVIRSAALRRFHSASSIGDNA